MKGGGREMLYSSKDKHSNLFSFFLMYLTERFSRVIWKQVGNKSLLGNLYRNCLQPVLGKYIKIVVIKGFLRNVEF